MAQLRIGTCSWKYDSWLGLVYSDLKKINYLKEYSEHFNTVEVDQWFWSLHGEKKVTLPRRKDVEEYSASVPEDFKFTIKIPNSVTLTHFYRKMRTDPLAPNPYFLNKDLFEQFLQSIELMKKNIGVLMFQFEYLNKQKMGSQLEFMQMLESFINECDDSYNYGIEIRNSNYLNKSYFEFLNNNKLSMIFLQGYYMPPVWEIFQSYKELIKQPVVIRLHGPDRKRIEEKSGGDWSKIIEPRDSELDKVVEMIRFFEDKNIDVYINVNNHFEGSAPLTIKRIKEQLRD